eukprot:gb/GECG01007135.1/.p1 GENE.gb/GECG01007135.1/~~gb/GECG01007135.1/.p1  ORF type:complete len:772 (+),score=102.37 gb/GECG01007135.1/:1-2316(+)
MAAAITRQTSWLDEEDGDEETESNSALNGDQDGHGYEHQPHHYNERELPPLAGTLRIMNARGRFKKRYFKAYQQYLYSFDKKSQGHDPLNAREKESVDLSQVTSVEWSDPNCGWIQIVLGNSKSLVLKADSREHAYMWTKYLKQRIQKIQGDSVDDDSADIAVSSCNVATGGTIPDWLWKYDQLSSRENAEYFPKLLEGCLRGASLADAEEGRQEDPHEELLLEGLQKFAGEMNRRLITVRRLRRDDVIANCIFKLDSKIVRYIEPASKATESKRILFLLDCIDLYIHLRQHLPTTRTEQPEYSPSMRALRDISETLRQRYMCTAIDVNTGRFEEFFEHLQNVIISPQSSITSLTDELFRECAQYVEVQFEDIDMVQQHRDRRLLGKMFQIFASEACIFSERLLDTLRYHFAHGRKFCVQPIAAVLDGLVLLLDYLERIKETAASINQQQQQKEKVDADTVRELKNSQCTADGSIETVKLHAHQSVDLLVDISVRAISPLLERTKKNLQHSRKPLYDLGEALREVFGEAQQLANAIFGCITGYFFETYVGLVTQHIVLFSLCLLFGESNNSRCLSRKLNRQDWQHYLSISNHHIADFVGKYLNYREYYHLLLPLQHMKAVLEEDLEQLNPLGDIGIKYTSEVWFSYIVLFAQLLQLREDMSKTVQRELIQQLRFDVVPETVVVEENNPQSVDNSKAEQFHPKRCFAYAVGMIFPSTRREYQWLKKRENLPDEIGPIIQDPVPRLNNFVFPDDAIAYEGAGSSEAPESSVNG